MKDLNAICKHCGREYGVHSSVLKLCPTPENHCGYWMLTIFEEGKYTAKTARTYTEEEVAKMLVDFTGDILAEYEAGNLHRIDQYENAREWLNQRLKQK